MKKIVVTGAAGFIGYHVCRALMSDEQKGQYGVIGIDNFNGYYDVALKKKRAELLDCVNEGDLCKYTPIYDEIFEDAEIVIHLAAQPGVRYGVEHPYVCLENNVNAFLTVLELCRLHRVKHLIYASSSSVYGNTPTPWYAKKSVTTPVSLYAATKRSCELMARAYSEQFKLQTTGLRFFNVYGPWGRPDNAYYSFTKAIYTRNQIPLFGYGKTQRDYTYIDDIVKRIMDLVSPLPCFDINGMMARIFNVGTGIMHTNFDVLTMLQQITGIEANCRILPMQTGDVNATYDGDAVSHQHTSLEDGLRLFVEWFKGYHHIEI